MRVRVKGCTPQALLDEATSYFRKALEFAPDSELHTAHYNMANVIADAADNGPCESKDALTPNPVLEF